MLRASASGTSSEESYSGSDSEDAAEGVRGSVNLTLERLQSMHAVATNASADASQFAQNGKSKERVKKALHNPACSCACKMPFKVLLRVAVTFWLLTKQAQDTVLWSIQKEDPGSGSKKDWYIEGGLRLFESYVLTGHHVCKVAWLHLLGLGQKRLQRCKGIIYGKDGRSILGRASASISIGTAHKTL